VVDLRRRLHEIPEIAWHENRTAAAIRRWLDRAGIEWQEVADTGTVAIVGNSDAKVVGIRSDIDGLPIEEQTHLEFRSRHPGFMHACGHDAHMAVVCGCATILKQLESELDGTVKLWFQPAEEEPPGGAQAMIAEGVMSDPAVNMVFGLHVNPEITTGRVGLRQGPLMAGVLDFDIKICGKGGHAALPHRANDVIVAISELVGSLQTIASRRVDPLDPVVVSMGRIEGGKVRNVLPSESSLSGTVRAFSRSLLKTVQRQITTIATGVARANGCRAEVTFGNSYPPLINSLEAVECLERSVRTMRGARALVWIRNPVMGGEDFARYLELAPGAMFHLGIRNSRVGSVQPWHHPGFLVDEGALPVGIEVLTNAVFEYLDS
jgi:amidohydrolase